MCRRWEARGLGWGRLWARLWARLWPRLWARLWASRWARLWARERPPVAAVVVARELRHVPGVGHGPKERVHGGHLFERNSNGALF